MTGPPVVTVEGSDLIGHARNLLALRSIEHLVVVRQEEVVGVVTRSDVLRHLTERGYEAEEDPVGNIMSHPAITIAPADPLGDAAGLMASRRIGCLPVVEGGRLAGIISVTDLLQHEASRPAPGVALDLSATARSVMHPRPAAVAPETMLFGALAVMRDRQVRHLPVVDAARKVVGVISDRDIREEAGDPRAALLDGRTAERLRNIPVSEVMSTPPWTVTESASLFSVAAQLIERRVGALPVVDEDQKLVGIISYVDLIRVLR
jgi:CBS domain-containing protein